jgi:hypothetical protein
MLERSAVDGGGIVGALVAGWVLAEDNELE